MEKKTDITIIIFGKNGQVATDLLKIFATKGQFKIINYSSKDIDFSDLEKVKFFLAKRLPKADFIINATAYNLVDLAEDEKEKADNINHKSVSLIAKYCQEKQIKFIHYSTNYIFDGRSKSAYKEDNIENLKPLGVYGESKLAGENSVVNSGCNYLIFRVSAVFNLSKEKNFISKIRKLAENNKELKIVDDQITNPTNSHDIAKATINIIENITQINNFKNNIYNLSSKKGISYFEFAKKITSDLNNIKIIPVSSDHFPSKAKRPLNGALNCNKIKKDFNIEISDYGF